MQCSAETLMWIGSQEPKPNPPYLTLSTSASGTGIQNVSDLPLTASQQGTDSLLV